MLNRTPSQKAHEVDYHVPNESTGNLIEGQALGDASRVSTSTDNTPSSYSSSGPGPGPGPGQRQSGAPPTAAAAAAAQEQHQKRLRLQQENQPQMRPRPRRQSTLRRVVSSRNANNGNQPPPVQRRPSTIARAKKKLVEREIELTAWVVVSRIFTCCIPSSLLRCCNGKKFARAQVIQAWREKVTLCLIIMLICGLLAFVIFGLEPTMCPKESSTFEYTYPSQNGALPQIGKNNLSFCYYFLRIEKYKKMERDIVCAWVPPVEVLCVDAREPCFLVWAFVCWWRTETVVASGRVGRRSLFLRPLSLTSKKKSPVLNGVYSGEEG